MKRKPWSPRRDAIDGVIFMIVAPFVATAIVVLATITSAAIVEWVWQIGLEVWHEKRSS